MAIDDDAKGIAALLDQGLHKAAQVRWDTVVRDLKFWETVALKDRITKIRKSAA